jgi:hypothetical protein
VARPRARREGEARGRRRGIVTFEQEFLAHMVLPTGASVFETVAPAVEHAYTTGDVRPLLQIGATA